MFSTQKSAGLLFTLCFVAFTMYFSSYLLIPALPSFATIFHVSEDNTKYILSIFFAGLLLAYPIAGKLFKHRDSKTILLLGASIYTMGSLITLITQQFHLLLLGRLLQAGGCGISNGILFNLVLNCYFENQQRRVINILMAVSIIVPIIAPLLGGLVTAHLDPQCLWIIFVITGMINILLAQCFAPVVTYQQVPTVSFLASLQLMFNTKSFITPIFISGLLAGGLAMFIINYPIIGIVKLGLSTSSFGIYFTIGAIANLTGIYLARWLTEFISETKILLLGLLICSCSAIILLHCAFLGDINKLFTILSIVFFMLGFGIFTPNAIYMGIHALKGSRVEYKVSSTINAVRMLGTVIFSVLATVLTTDNTKTLAIVISLITITSLFLLLWRWKQLAK